jgi:hypothetical protein
MVPPIVEDRQSGTALGLWRIAIDRSSGRPSTAGLRIRPDASARVPGPPRIRSGRRWVRTIAPGPVQAIVLRWAVTSLAARDDRSRRQCSSPASAAEHLCSGTKSGVRPRSDVASAMSPVRHLRRDCRSRRALELERALSSQSACQEGRAQNVQAEVQETVERVANPAAPSWEQNPRVRLFGLEPRVVVVPRVSYVSGFGPQTDAVSLWVAEGRDM